VLDSLNERKLKLRAASTYAINKYNEYVDYLIRKIN
jgi:hypothetical protein